MLHWFICLILSFFSMTLCHCNDIVVEIATEYLDAANSFYSGRDKQKFYQHLADDFEWFLGSQSFATKQAFVASNEAAFGAVNNVFGHYEIISYANSHNDKSTTFVIVKLSTFVQQKKCNEWFENMEIFTFNQRNEIKTAYVVFIDQNEYTAKQMTVNHPNCTMSTDETTESYDDIQDILERFVDKIAEGNNDSFGDIMTDDCNSIGDPLYKEVASNDIKHIHFKQYGIGSSNISGFLYYHIQSGECQIIVREFVVLYINKDIKKIDRVIQLPVDNDLLQTFNDCVSKNVNLHPDL